MLRQTLMVTGAGGFIGRAITESLCRERYRVVACVSPNSTVKFTRGIPVYRMSLPNEHLGDLVARERPRWLIHCAGSASVGASLQDPTQDWKANVGVTSELYGALAKYSPETNVVFMSSAAVYGQPSVLPITEATPVAPISPYGLHKRTCELIGSDYERRFGMKCINLRIFSAYGPGLQKQVLWDIYRKATAASTVLLDGTGQETRDLIHVNDIARLI